MTAEELCRALHEAIQKVFEYDGKPSRIVISSRYGEFAGIIGKEFDAFYNMIEFADLREDMNLYVESEG